MMESDDGSFFFFFFFLLLSYCSAEGADPAVGRQAEVVEHAAEAPGPVGPLPVCLRSRPVAVAVTTSFLRKTRLRPVEEVREHQRVVLHQALHVPSISLLVAARRSVIPS